MKTRVLPLFCLASLAIFLASCVESPSRSKSLSQKEKTERRFACVMDSMKMADLYLMQFQQNASYKNLMKLCKISKSLHFNFNDEELDNEDISKMSAGKFSADSMRMAIENVIAEKLPMISIPLVSYSDHLIESKDKICFYAKKGDTLNINGSFPSGGSIRLYNANSRELIRAYIKRKAASDHYCIPNTAIYMLEVTPVRTQYIDLGVSLQYRDIDQLLNPKRVKTEQVEASKGDWQVQAVNGVKMKNLFEEPRKFTLRGQLKASFSGSYRALVALQVPRGATDVMYSLRISTNEGNTSNDGKFKENMNISYKKIKFLGLPLYESQRGSGLLATILGENQPLREEDAYINMYVFFDAGQARKFQDGKPTSELKYHVDYSTMGTQSCNGRIPSNGRKTIYLGFENERMRYNNYVWLEAVSAVPHTEYFKTKYSVDD